MKETYQMHQDELLKQMNADPGGLSSEEAARRLQEYGENALEEQARKRGILGVNFYMYTAVQSIVILIAIIFENVKNRLLQ